MDAFDFEELMAEILGVSDDQRENDDFLPDEFYKKYDIDFEAAYNLTKTLLLYTPTVTSPLTENKYHAFISRKGPFMLMKAKAKDD